MIVVHDSESWQHKSKTDWERNLCWVTKRNKARQSWWNNPWQFLVGSTAGSGCVVIRQVLSASLIGEQCQRPAVPFYTVCNAHGWRLHAPELLLPPITSESAATTYLLCQTVCIGFYLLGTYQKSILCFAWTWNFLYHGGMQALRDLRWGRGEHHRRRRQGVHTAVARHGGGRGRRRPVQGVRWLLPEPVVLQPASPVAHHRVPLDVVLP